MKNVTRIQKAIRDLRKLKGVTQQELAVELQLAVSSVARYEAGKPPEPAVVARLAEIAETLGDQDLAAVFNDAVASRIGVSVHSVVIATGRIKKALAGLTAISAKHPDLQPEIIAIYSNLNIALNCLREIKTPLGEG